RVLRRQLGQPDDGSTRADRLLRRRTLRGDGPRLTVIAHHLVVPGLVPVADAVRRGGAELLPRHDEPDPAARAGRLLHPRGCHPGTRSAAAIARIPPRRPDPEDPPLGALL